MPDGIYVAGPMRGYPNWNYQAFADGESDLKKQGWSNVINPATLDDNYEDTKGLGAPEDFDPYKNESHQDANRRIMKRDVDVICDDCIAIYMLRGWESSKGACAEFYLAASIGLEIHYQGAQVD
jgi:hypothetical protein